MQTLINYGTEEDQRRHEENHGSSHARVILLKVSLLSPIISANVIVSHPRISMDGSITTQDRERHHEQ